MSQKDSPDLFKKILSFSANIGTEPILLAFTALFLILGCLVNLFQLFLTSPPVGVQGYVIIFRDIISASICAALALIIFLKFASNQKLIDINSELKELNYSKSVFFPPYGIDEKIKKFLSNTNNDPHSIIAICYGTNSFGQIFDLLADGHFERVKEVTLLFCCPKSKMIQNETDSLLIRDGSKKLLKNQKISIHYTCTLPTIRAMIVNDRNHSPIWCSVQTYLIHKYQIKGMKSRSVALIGDQKGSSFMDELVKFVRSEFDRLQSEKDDITQCDRLSLGMQKCTKNQDEKCTTSV